MIIDYGSGDYGRFARHLSLSSLNIIIYRKNRIFVYPNSTEVLTGTAFYRSAGSLFPGMSVFLRNIVNTDAIFL